LLTGLPIALVSFAVLIVGLCMSLGAVILVGLPVALVTLLVARGFARLERARLGAVGSLAMPLSTITWCVAVVWWSGAFFGLSSWWLHIWFKVLVYTGLGLVLLLSLMPVIHGCTLMHVRLTSSVLDPEIVAQLLVRQRSGVSLESLSPRERGVLALMAEGRSNGAIGRRLVISDGAVEKHVPGIFSKLGLAPSDADHRRVPAVLAWLRGGQS
jgi:DNA-binding CsgD family transcriptional regulator